ncbi:peptidoglycan recognition protein family protein [Crossiella sp. CA198]|uniref:peptidoglycan recognition protein family protein n=1 Tax=Crossiella sp. CA198 TaxID=3455607 RepID=UPI003F8D2F6A
MLRAAGLRVHEEPGWRTRGHGHIRAVRGVLVHHTGTDAGGVYPSLRVVRDGRTGLAGPLAQLGLGRDGTWYVIAAGLAYHAGKGVAPDIPTDAGNNYLIGVEAESTGRGDWTAAQRESYPRGVAAILRHARLGADRCIAHKEYARPVGRKVDPHGWPGDMNGFRATVAAWLRGTNEGDDMANVPQWQWDRIYDRVLTNSKGVSGQNHDGAQYAELRTEVYDRLARVEGVVAEIARKINDIQVGGVNEAELAERLAVNIAGRLAA